MENCISFRMEVWIKSRCPCKNMEKLVGWLWTSVMPTHPQRLDSELGWLCSVNSCLVTIALQKEVPCMASASLGLAWIKHPQLSRSTKPAPKEFWGWKIEASTFSLKKPERGFVQVEAETLELETVYHSWRYCMAWDMEVCGGTSWDSHTFSLGPATESKLITDQILYFEIMHYILVLSSTPWLLQQVSLIYFTKRRSTSEYLTLVQRVN